MNTCFFNNNHLCVLWSKNSSIFSNAQGRTLKANSSSHNGLLEADGLLGEQKSGNIGNFLILLTKPSSPHLPHLCFIYTFLLPLLLLVTPSPDDLQPRSPETETTQSPTCSWNAVLELVPWQ